MKAGGSHDLVRHLFGGNLSFVSGSDYSRLEDQSHIPFSFATIMHNNPIPTYKPGGLHTTQC